MIEPKAEISAVELCEHEYTESEFLDMELHLVKSLGYELDYVTCID